MVLVIPKIGASSHIIIGHSALDPVIPDKFLENPSYMPSFGEKDKSNRDDYVTKLSNNSGLRLCPSGIKDFGLIIP